MVFDDVTEALRLTMRCFASSVTILSALHDGRRYAMAATSVQSLSFDPPSILTCVNRSAAMHLPLLDGSAFCVNILATSHVEVAKACGGGLRGEERFAVGDWDINDNGVPYLADAQASLFCACDGHIPYGTHGIFIGKILDARMQDEISPLLYADGAYRQVSADPVN